MAAAMAAGVVVRLKKRRVEELYNATEIIDEPEITPVLRGSYCMQGPMDEIDHSIEKNMVPPKTVKQLVRRYMSQKVHTKSESGTCNVCSAPCSSCMHRSIGQMGSKNDEFSDETDRVAVASQHSINEDKAGDSLQHIPSEASNLLSVNSSHDSYSENIESKATIRPPDVSDALEDVDTERTFLKAMMISKYDGSKVLEGHDDNISCASRASDANPGLSCCNKDLDSKNSSRSSVSICSLGSGKVLSSQKLDLSELPCIKEVDASSCSVRMQSPYSHSQNGKSTVGGSSEISSKIHPKSEADIDSSSGAQLDNADKLSNEDEQDKSNELVDLPDKQASPLPAVSGEESYESDATEHDVKVCDICGDAGREDLLAICSKCSDGAEHTYCMQVMLQKVPEGYWLCEECKLVEEIESQKQDSGGEGKRANKVSSSTQNSGKRHAENQEGASTPKKQAVETNMASTKSLSPSRVPSFSREGSFKNLDKGKVKPSPPISLGNHSGTDMPEAARSPPSGPRLQTSKGTLLKSNSFNTLSSKPKVKLVDEVVIQKQKGSREHASLDTKEEPARMMGKSMSFKSAHSGWLNTGESKFKRLQSKYHPVPDLKGLKPVKERIPLERKNFSKLDRSSSTVSTPKVDQRLTPRSNSSASNLRESKIQSDGKASTLSRSTINLSRKGVENAVSSAIGASSINGRISSEQKLNQISMKEEPSSSSSWATDGQPSNVNGVVLDGLSRSLDSTDQSEKSRESAVGLSSKGVPCLKCKEVGHTAEYCSASQASGADISVPRTSREEINKGNKLKAAIEAAIRMRPGLCERTSQDPSSVSNKAKNIIPVEGSHEGQTNLHNQASIGNIKLLNSQSTDAVSIVSAVGNHSMKDTSVLPLASTSAISGVMAIPELEYIWQGAFEVRKSGKRSDIFGGIQAHLSTLASPKVLEVVNTFPHKVSLNEVTRLSTWPTQFHASGPKEDNIALYFFAKDLDSYEKNYKVLLDIMVKNDLALKGNFEGVELLIFPSNQLPEDCQRWNSLIFLWGVFRGRRAKCSNSSTSACIPDASVVHLEGEISTDIPQPVNESATCDNSSNVVPVIGTAEKTCILTDRVSDKNCSSLEQRYGMEAKVEEQDGIVDSTFLSRIAARSTEVHQEMKCTSPSEEGKVPDCRFDTELRPCIQATETKSSSVKVEKEEMHIREDYPSLEILPVGKREATVGSVVEKIDGDRVKFRDPKDDGYADDKTSLKGDPDRWQSNPRKRPYLDLTETVSEMSADTSRTMPWSEVKTVSVGVESDNKRLKPGFSGIYQYSSAIDRVPFSDSLASDKHDMGSCSSIEEKRCDIACEEKVIPEDSGSSERFFFPVGSHHSREFRLGDNSIPWKELHVKDDDRVHDVSPNLELALGAEKRPPNPPSKGILPFLVGAVDKNTNEDRPLDKVPGKEEEDDISASLSLSLSFPFPEKERNVKSVSKTEPLLPEKHPVNTSLLLFRPFPEK